MIDKFAEPREPIKLTACAISAEERLIALEQAVRGFYVDPGADWVGRVVRERMLADLHTRMLREAPAVAHAR